jgi:hypothetical protein
MSAPKRNGTLLSDGTEIAVSYRLTVRGAAGHNAATGTLGTTSENNLKSLLAVTAANGMRHRLRLETGQEIDVDLRLVGDVVYFESSRPFDF